MEEEYQALKGRIIRKKSGREIHALIFRVIDAASRVLDKCERVALKSSLDGKFYHKFVGSKGYASRPINSGLILESLDEASEIFRVILRGGRKEFTADQITRTGYTIGISCCAGIDVTRKSKNEDRQSSLFDWLFEAMMETILGVRPERDLEVLNLDLKGKFPTDLVFELGCERPNFHFPVRTSTSKQAIQIWAQQRMIDNIYGNGRFLGIPVILSEASIDSKTDKVSEICLPWQWRLYQMHIATLWHVCYFDAPSAYLKLNHVFPPIRVVTIGDLLQVGGKMDELLAEHRL